MVATGLIMSRSLRTALIGEAARQAHRADSGGPRDFQVTSGHVHSRTDQPDARILLE